MRVTVYHGLGFVWLSYVFPAMGVMFALGGSLMAVSLRRGGVVSTVRSRVRRLLPSMWALGVLVVPLSLWLMWRADATALPSADLLLWVLPMGQPGGGDQVLPATIVLWYLVTYLWLVLLSPLLLAAFRRWPLWTVLAPLAVLAATQLSGLDLASTAGDGWSNVATFGACWVLGFAHRDGLLRRLPVPVWLLSAASAGGRRRLGVHPSGRRRHDGPQRDPARAGPLLGRLRDPAAAPHADAGLAAPHRPLDWLVTLVNARAVTIYLWHNIAISASEPLGDRLDVWRFATAAADALTAVLMAALLAAAVLGAGLGRGRRRPAPPEGNTDRKSQIFLRRKALLRKTCDGSVRSARSARLVSVGRLARTWSPLERPVRRRFTHGARWWPTQRASAARAAAHEWVSRAGTPTSPRTGRCRAP